MAIYSVLLQLRSRVDISKVWTMIKFGQSLPSASLFISGRVVRSVSIAAAGLVTAGIIAACGSADEPSAPSAASPTSSTTATVATTTTSTTMVPPAALAPEPAIVPPVAVTPEAIAAPVLMPPVVCMNLQTAQNLIQDAGVFFSRSEDATGAGRAQINDSNWIVVDQIPGVGVPIEEGDAVLSVVKIDEPNNC
jgi:hypothetical protein